MVLDIGSIVEGAWDKVETEIKEISIRTRELGLISKVSNNRDGISIVKRDRDGE
ncbi:MAG: hypothetical protein RQ885_04510 [Desulfurococcales archaeon]|jgi:deoxyribose-phosphate aldolase|nr:hypothetical protein [Desulfurococcales archaeon]